MDLSHVILDLSSVTKFTISVIRKIWTQEVGSRSRIWFGENNFIRKILQELVLLRNCSYIKIFSFTRFQNSGKLKKENLFCISICKSKQFYWNNQLTYSKHPHCHIWDYLLMRSLINFYYLQFLTKQCFNEMWEYNI